MTILTIRNSIMLSFAAVLVIMLAMAASTYAWFNQTAEEARRIREEIGPGVALAGQFTANWNDLHRLVLEFELAATPAEAEAARAEVEARRATLANLAEAYRGTIRSDRDREHFKVVETIAGEIAPTIDQVLATPSATGPDPVGRTPAQRELESQFEEMRAALATLLDFNLRDAEASTDRILDISRLGQWSRIVTAAIALAVAFLCGLMLFRAVTRPMSQLLSSADRMRAGDFSGRLVFTRRDEFAALAEGFNAMADDLASLIGQIQRFGIQVSTSITEVAATAKEQQATAAEISATTTEIGATAKQISATSKELVRTMEEISSVADETATLAGSGQSSLSRMGGTMQQVVDAAAAINAKLTVLSEKAANINQVVTTITKVADQTNLLSLNAAIEAEKAGQHGRGFAVVATEIRRLADQAAVSSYDIEQMVKEIHAAVSASVMGMDRFSEDVRRGMTDMQTVGGQLSHIIDRVQGLVPQFEMANEGMQAQSTGAAQISDGLVQLGEAARQTAESQHQSTVAIDALKDVSDALRTSVSRFRLRD